MSRTVKSRPCGGWDASAYKRVIAGAVRRALSGNGLSIARHEEEDLVQETLLRAWRLVEPSMVQFPTGLLQLIARCVVTDRERHLRAWRRLSHGISIENAGVCESIATPEASPLERAEAKDALEERLKAARKLLPYRHYCVYVMRRVHCMNAEKTGAALGVSVAAVNSIMSRAKKRLDALVPKAGMF